MYSALPLIAGRKDFTPTDGQNTNLKVIFMKLRTSLVVLTILVSGGFAAAQPDMGQMLSPRMGNLKFDIAYDGSGYFKEGTSGFGREMGWVDNDVRFSAPLMQNETFEWSAYAGVGAMKTTGDAYLPDSWDRFPRALWDIRFGTVVRKKLENQWIIGGQLEVGSPSDKPFASLEETSVTANAFVQIPWMKGLSWVILMNYSSNREFLPHAPLPGVALNYRPDRNLHVIAGVPFSMVRWRPKFADAFELSASYFMMRTVHAKIGYDLMKNLQVYVGYDWDNERYFRHDRLYDHHRLFYYEMRLKTGVRWEISKDIYVDAFGGYAFDRFWFEASEFDDRDRNRIEISDGMFLGLRAGLRF